MDHTKESLRELKDFIVKEHASATYTCGGSIPIVSLCDNESKYANERATDVSTEPITIRWSRSKTEAEPSSNNAPEVTLPSNDPTVLSQLLRDMQTASFGYGGKNVIDETYRKASKMDASQFCTNFSPYVVGICDAIAQVLMPSVKGSDCGRSLRAELYKLNVYSGPSGKFHAHVDTPRSPTQFGSLVVCLPFQHEGGQLVVKHEGQTKTFDWSNNASQELKWAAFYSDCSHEVLEVTSGHRVTLTYNLYQPTTPDSWNEVQPIDATTYPLYGFVANLLRDPEFMKKGGTIGIPCSHAYPHTSDEKHHGLPAALKGVDMAMVVVFSALGLQPRLRPILHDAASRFEEEDERYGMYDSQDDDDEEDTTKQDDAEPILCDYQEFQKSQTVVGTHMHRFKAGGEVGEDSTYREMLDGRWDHTEEKVTWCGSAKLKTEVALAYLTYGNEWTMDLEYSFAAILAQVPPSEKRTTFPFTGRVQ